MNKTESKSRSQKEFGKKNVLAQKQNKYRKQVQTAHKTLKKTIESKNRQDYSKMPNMEELNKSLSETSSSTSQSSSPDHKFYFGHVEDDVMYDDLPKLEEISNSTLPELECLD